MHNRGLLSASQATQAPRSPFPRHYVVASAEIAWTARAKLYRAKVSAKIEQPLS